MSRADDVRAGIFVVAALLILAVGTIWIVGFDPFGSRGTEFDVMMKSSGGVQRGDRVRLAGVEVGRVDDVGLFPGEEWPVVFTVSVQDDVEIAEDATARITADGMLGANYLEIVTPLAGERRLASGGTIYGSGSGDAMAMVGELADRATVLIDQLIDLTGSLSGDIEPVLAGVESMLTEDNASNFSASLESLRGTLAIAETRLPALLDRLDGVAARADSSLEGFPDLTADLKALTASLSNALGEDGERLAGVLDAAGATLGNADGTLNTLKRSGPELEALVRDLREAAANLKSLSQTLKERPALLVRHPRPPKGKAGETEQP